MHPDSTAATTDHPGPSGREYDYEVVIVAYRSRDLIEQLLSTLPLDLPLVIVDNGHGVDGLDELANARPATRYLDGPGRGYAAGANVGARSSTARHLVFVNPDSSPTVEQLDELVSGFARDPLLAVTCVTTVLPDGDMEIGVGGWEPTVGRAFVHAIGAHKLFPTAGLWATPVEGRPIDLDWLGGACLSVPRQRFVELGGMDESFFVYSEDVAFGRTVREAGLRQVVRTDIVVPHLGGGSGDSKPRMLQLRGAMMMQYVARHNGAARRHGIRLVLTAGIAARYVVCRARGRAGEAAEHSAYVRGLWAGAPDMS